MSIEDWLDQLQSSDRAFYNMMAMEVWSIAKSMDTLQHGFWNRFMENRHTAMRKLLSKRRNSSTKVKTSTHPTRVGRDTPAEETSGSEEIIMFPPRSSEGSN
ncbi:MAG: hypothetical protein VKJ24_17695 [Synechococcales bacterium]|nr:hypothetical protein [Synechococcales bacterium]